MKRRPYLLLMALVLLAFCILFAVWRERHRQQARAHEASISASRDRSTMQQGHSLASGANPRVRDVTELLRTPHEIPQNVAQQPVAPSSAPLTESALMAATRQGDLERVQSLLAAGAQMLPLRTTEAGIYCAGLPRETISLWPARCSGKDWE